jgi:hypothetical protein
MRDLSAMPLARTSLATDSMLATNQIFESNSMKAPGGATADLPDRGELNATVHAAPVIEVMSPQLPVGTPPRRLSDTYTPGPVSWKETTDG